MCACSVFGGTVCWDFGTNAGRFLQEISSEDLTQSYDLGEIIRIVNGWVCVLFRSLQQHSLESTHTVRYSLRHRFANGNFRRCRRRTWQEGDKLLNLLEWWHFWRLPTVMVIARKSAGCNLQCKSGEGEKGLRNARWTSRMECPLWPLQSRRAN